jgi:F-type H+-transporting ATPase subunit delta
MAHAEQSRRIETVLDPSARRVARVYSEALFGAAAKQNQVEELLEELDALVGRVFKADPQFEVFLSSSAIDRPTKAAAIRRAFEGRASDLLLNTLLVLNDHERLELLRAIVATYRELRDQQAGRMRVHIRSAVPLPDDQRQRLQQQLRQQFQKEPILDEQVDPELLGGLVVRVGDWLYDGSVRSELVDIRNQIIARSSYEIQSRRDRFSSRNGD